MSLNSTEVHSGHVGAVMLCVCKSEVSSVSGGDRSSRFTGCVASERGGSEEEAEDV